MIITKKFLAKKNYSRIDHFLRETLKEMSRSQIELLFKEDRISLNTKPIHRKNLDIFTNDIVEIKLDIEEVKEYSPSFQLNKKI